jgi:hypothetical protein
LNACDSTANTVRSLSLNWGRPNVSGSPPTCGSRAGQEIVVGAGRVPTGATGRGRQVGLSLRLGRSHCLFELQQLRGELEAGLVTLDAGQVNVGARRLGQVPRSHHCLHHLGQHLVRLVHRRRRQRPITTHPPRPMQLGYLALQAGMVDLPQRQTPERREHVVAQVRVVTGTGRGPHTRSDGLRQRPRRLCCS